jgi:hypothetical protein
MVKLHCNYYVSFLHYRAYKYRSETLPDGLVGNAWLVELFRQSQCAAFNTLVAIISIKSDLNYFTCFLFRENNAKEVLSFFTWTQLAECGFQYSLSS